MNLFRDKIPGSAARRCGKLLKSLAEALSRRDKEEFSFQNKMPHQRAAFPGDVLGAPQDLAGNNRATRKEQAKCLRSQLLYRQDAGVPRKELCASAPLREKFLKVFSIRNKVPHQRAAFPGCMFASQVLYRQDAGAPRKEFCVSAPLREVLKKSQIKICVICVICG